MKILCLILALSVYTQSFGYYALSAASHTDCHEKEEFKKTKTKFCCTSKLQKLTSNGEHQKTENCQTDSKKENCCSQDLPAKDSKGCNGGDDCDCHCCFHFHGLQIICFGLFKIQYLTQVTFYKSKYTFKDALEKDRHFTIFHPPQYS